MALLLVQVRSGRSGDFCLHLGRCVPRQSLLHLATEIAATIPGCKIDGALVAPMRCSGAPLEWSQCTRQAEVYCYQRLGEPWCESLAGAQKKRSQQRSGWESVSALRGGPWRAVGPVFDLLFSRAASPCVSLRL
jgi:hypothetical protein